MPVAALLQQVGADRVEAPAGVDAGVAVKPVEQFEAGVGAGCHGDGDGVVERDDGIVIQAEKDAVEGRDLRPVGGIGALRFVVDRGDRGLQLVGPGSGPGGGWR